MNYKLLKCALCTMLFFTCSFVSAQRIVYNTHTKTGARVLETSQKKVGAFGKGAKKVYMWAGLASLDVKGSAVYSVRVMYTSEYHISVKKDAKLILVLDGGREVTLTSAAHAESKQMDGVETVFASYDISETDLKDIAKKGVEKVIIQVDCFGVSEYSRKTSLWKMARPLSLRYDLLREYIEKNVE